MILQMMFLPGSRAVVSLVPTPVSAGFLLRIDLSQAVCSLVVVRALGGSEARMTPTL